MVTDDAVQLVTSICRTRRQIEAVAIRMTKAGQVDTDGDWLAYLTTLGRADAERLLVAHLADAEGKQVCERCAGFGGAAGWPGWTCYECGGRRLT